MRDMQPSTDCRSPSLSCWLVAYCAGVARAVLEYYIYTNGPVSFADTMVHFPLSFVCFAISIAIATALISGYPVGRACTYACMGLFVIVLVPIIDAFVYGMKERTILYLAPSGNPVQQFIDAVFRGKRMDSISVGQLCVVHGTAITMGVVAWLHRKRCWAAIASWISTLVIVFTWSQMPSLAGYALDTANSLMQGVLGMRGHVPARFGPAASYLGSESVLVTAVYVLSLQALLVCIFYCCERKHLSAIIRNIRATRLLHYCAMCVLGMLISVKELHTLETFLREPANIVAVAVLLNAVALCFIGSVWLNDVYDRSIDAASNSNRPIATGEVGAREGTIIGTALMVSGWLCAALLGVHLLSLMTVVIVLSFAYSVPPLRLRRFFPVSILIIALINLLVVQMGFSLFNAGRPIFLPARLALGIFAGLALIITFKDLKDSISDRGAGVFTLASRLPELWGLWLTRASVMLGAIVLAYTLAPGKIGLTVGIVAGTTAAALFPCRGLKEACVFGVYYLGLAWCLALYVSV